MRWRGLALTPFVAAWWLTGCDDRTAREFAVTVIDSAEIACTGVSNSAAFEQSTMDALAKDRQRAYEKAHESAPPTAEGRRLWVNELEHRVEAWFEQQPGQPPVSGTRFDSPLVVYGGDPQEDFIEATYVEIINTDDEDEDVGRELCGPRPTVSGTLSVTDTGGIAGRVRWTEYSYMSSVTSACPGWIACVRDIQLEGLEVD